MAKWCYNYESGDYEYIDRDGFSWDRGEYVYNWDDSEYRKEEEERREEERREEERREEERREEERQSRSLRSFFDDDD